MTGAAGKTALKARYFKADGKSGKARELPGDPFDGVVHEESVYAAVNAYLANQRQGTASAKNRPLVRGGGRKPWRQKGTGRARQGTIRSPIWRGGAVVFPPTPRSYRQSLPRKVKDLARRSAFNARALEDRVLLVEGPEFSEPKTRRLRELLKKLEVADAKVLFLTDGHRPEVYLSGRNLQNVEVRAWGTESVYDVVWADFVVIEEGVLKSGRKAPEPEEAGKPVKATEADAVANGDDETADHAGEGDDDA